MAWLLSAAACFVCLHLLVAGSPLRGVLVAAIGERAYRGLFSLASVAALWWLASSYSAAYATDNSLLFHVGMSPQHLAAPVMLFALWLAVSGLLSPNPTSVGQEGLLARQPEAGGIQRVTRHPFLWGVIIWSGFHLVANGDAASVVLFSAFLVVALAGTFSIDRKRARAFGDAWARYRATTSNLPFAAIVSRRNRLSWREIGWWRLLATLAVFALLVSLHPWLFGAYPLPGMAD